MEKLIKDINGEPIYADPKLVRERSGSKPDGSGMVQEIRFLRSILKHLDGNYLKQVETNLHLKVKNEALKAHITWLQEELKRKESGETTKA